MIRIPALTCEKFGHKQFLLYHRPSAQFTCHGKKSETDLTAGVLKKDQKCTKGCVNKTLFSWTKQNRMQIFKGILFFQPRTLQKQTNNLSATAWVLPATLDMCTRLGCVHEIQPSRVACTHPR